MKEELMLDMCAVMYATGLAGAIAILMALTNPLGLPLAPQALLILAGAGLVLFAYWCLLGIRKFRDEK